MRILLSIKDKVILNNGSYCPSHRLPHTLPVIGELVRDEQCHYHISRLRMTHHRVFCRVLRCPHYESMIEMRKELLRR